MRDGPAEPKGAQPTYGCSLVLTLSSSFQGHLESLRHDRGQVRVQPGALKILQVLRLNRTRQPELRVHSDQKYTEGYKHERGQPSGSRRWLQVTHV